MSNYTGRGRTYGRQDRTRSEPPKADTATTAIAAQVIICVLLLLCALAVRKTNEADYVRFKEQYSVMLNDPSQTDKAIEWIAGLGDVFKALRDGKPSSPVEEEKDIDEPIDESEPAADFEYDYLGYLGGNDVSAETGGIFSRDRSVLPAVYQTIQIRPPITGMITSGFAYRKHPLTDKSDYHTGIDVAAEEGHPISAAMSGTVEEVGWSRIYGNYIVLRHTPELKTSYSHCSEIVAKEGMFVRQGERIALVGQTGAATGPHLHFSVISDGEFTDPARLLNDYIEWVRQS